MNHEKRLNTNVPGNFFVSSACINCDQCRQIAPDTFSEVAHFSAVTNQPNGDDEIRKAFYALISCPTGAIGSEQKDGLTIAIQDFPLPIIDNIFYCGFTSQHSWGASSYLILHPEGNWLIDSPRWSAQLVKRIEEMGGIKYIFLTHRDDVADANKYAKRFKAERFIHALEIESQPDAEHVIQGRESIKWHEDFTFIMAPGHTKGHMVLLYRNKYLFSGDHLAWDHEINGLSAHRSVCWFSWKAQTESMERLAKEPFEWILPGHGNRVFLPPFEMKNAMAKLINQMKS
jgi:glyoxylase-like metal-dependent hydrolase (beta-lactamase superfamily II)/ferredoxin